jgi:hypothetical protein
MQIIDIHNINVNGASAWLPMEDHSSGATLSQVADMLRRIRFGESEKFNDIGTNKRPARAMGSLS